MSNRPLVSVIVIFFDAERFVEEAIASVFAQTYDHWELLLVDDGSTDGSRCVAFRCAERWPDRVRYLKHDGHRNRGMSASRNLGIRHSRGEYIALLDADDVWLPHKLEQQVAILTSQPEAAMVYGPSQWWYSWTGKPADQQRDFVHELGVPADSLIAPPSLLTLFLHSEGASPCTCSVLMRREVVEATGGFEEAFRGLYEDQAFFAKICLHAPVYASGECWYRYRQHADSHCAIGQRTGQYSSARLFFLDWLAAYLFRQGIEDRAVLRALHEERRALRPPVWYRLPGVSRPLVRHMRGLLGRNA